jgi:hypothetical protein
MRAMKRLLVVVVLATVCFCLLVSPAVAAKKTEPYRPPEDTAMLSIWGFGFGYMYHDMGDPSLDLAWWQAFAMPPTGDADLDAMWQPVPLDGVCLTLGWINTTYGQTKKVEEALEITVDVVPVDEAVVWSAHVDPDEVEWTHPFLQDEWWEFFAGGVFPLFNPSIGAGTYQNRPNIPVGPFPEPGWYHLTVLLDQVLPLTDHFFPDFDGDGLADWPGATTSPKGTFTWLIEFDFYVE